MSELLRGELLEHLRLVEEQISQETRDDADSLYRLNLLARERARVRRHIERLDDRGGGGAA